MEKKSEMVHGTTGTKRFKRVKLADSRASSGGAMQPTPRTQEQMNPFLFAPEEFAQQRRRHGGRLIAPTQFVPLDSAKAKQSTAMKLRKKQLSRATAEAERNAEIAKAIARAVRRERRLKSAAHAQMGDGGTVALGRDGRGVAVQHIVSVSDVYFASPEAAQLLCGEDIEWVDEDDSSSLSAEERARRRRKDILRYRTHSLRAHSMSARLRSAQKTQK